MKPFSELCKMKTRVGAVLVCFRKLGRGCPRDTSANVHRWVFRLQTHPFVQMLEGLGSAGIEPDTGNPTVEQNRGHSASM